MSYEILKIIRQMEYDDFHKKQLNNDNFHIFHNYHNYNNKYNIISLLDYYIIPFI